LECTGVRGLVEWTARSREEEGVGLCLAAERKSERAGERARLVVHGLGWSGLVWSGMGVK